MKKFYLFFCLLLAGSVVQAATRTWIGGGTTGANATSGNFSATTSWLEGAVPGSGDDVVFVNSANVTVTVDGDYSIKSITTGTLANVTFSSGTSAIRTINLGVGGSGTVLTVNTSATRRSLILVAGANDGGIIIRIPTGCSASINGGITFSTFYSTTGTAASGVLRQTAQVLGTDAGSIVFNSGASATCNYNLSTSPFYLSSYNNTNNDIVRFTSGSSITYYGGANIFGKASPDATAKFESGSNFIVFGGSNSGGAQLNGRTYGILTLGNGGTGTVVNSTNVTTTILDTLIMQGANLNFSNSGTGTASPTFAINNIRIQGNASLTLASDSSTSGTPRSASYQIGGINGIGGYGGTVSVTNLVSTSTNSSFVLGNSFGTTTNTATITFIGNGGTSKTISTSVLGTGTATVRVGNASSGTYTTNIIIDSTANIALDAALDLTSANNNTSLLVRTRGVLSVGTSRTLTTNGKLTLQSTSTGSASIDNNAGTISGNVTVERYIPSNNRKKYVLLSSPVTSTLNAGWQEAGATISGYGTHITQAGGGSTNGYDGNAASNASLFTYNDDNASGSKWVASSAATTTAASLAPGIGYLLFVRGDRAENRPATGNSSNTVLRATGAVGQGIVSPTLKTGASQYTLIANPYPCAIDWNSSNTNLTKTNLTGSFTVYDSNLGVFVSSNGTTKTPNSGNQQAQYIQSGQAFFVQNNGTGSGAITFTEAAKTTSVTTTSSTTVFGQGSANEQLNINVYRTADNSFADGVVALFGSNFKTAVDNNEDITKFTNLNETFGLRRNNTVLGLEARPLVLNNDTLFFSLSSFAKKSYNLVIDGSNFAQTTSAQLQDKFTGVNTTIDVNGKTDYNFTVTADAASSSNDRFMITFGSTATSTVIADGITAASLYVKMSPNPVVNQLQVSFKTATVAPIRINVVNSLGQVVKTVNAGEVSSGIVNVPVAGLASGVYNVQLISAGKVISTQQVVKAKN